MEAVDLWFLDVCWLTPHLVSQPKELHCPEVRQGARIVEGQLALHGLFNAHTARHLQVGRKAMVGVIDAAAEEGDLFLDFLRECE